MEALNLVQNTPEWHEHRAAYFNASDAPAMMGVSKYVSRDELLYRYKTGTPMEINAATQKLFDDGHRFEKMARPIAEGIIGDELYPITGATVIDDLPLSTSLDGSTLDESVIFEHKSINHGLRATGGDVDQLDEMYKIQMDQQLLISGAGKCLFMASDGTEDDMVWCWYETTDERKQAIIDGWKQFEKDLESFEIPETKLEAVGNSPENFPMVTYEISGTELTSNISDVLAKVRERAEVEMSRELKTDQDFADKDELNKATKQAREDLKHLVKNAQGQFVSFSEFASLAADLDSVLQKMQSHGEKLVKSEKDNRKREIADTAKTQLGQHCAELEIELNGLRLPEDLLKVDFIEPMKGKRTIESLNNAVNTRLAQAKIDAETAAKTMRTNLNTLQALTGGEYDQLFNDLSVVIHKQRDDFEALVTLRVQQEKDRIAKVEEDAKEQARIAEETRQADKPPTAEESNPIDEPVKQETVIPASDEGHRDVSPATTDAPQDEPEPTPAPFFDWWMLTGQHLAPKPNESQEDFIRRVARAAWNAASPEPF